MKHIGRRKNDRRKLVVAYRVIPGDPDNCLVVQTDSLNADYHDAMIQTLESNMGQSAYEFAEAMNRAFVPDGRNMLKTFHREGKLTKLPTNMVEMMPNMQTTIMLDELNKVIAEQKGVTVADLAVGADQVKKTPENSDPKMEPLAAATQYNEDSAGNVEEVITIDEKPLDDEALAASYRSQADAMFKEAKRLRTEAEKLTEGSKEESVDAAD